MLGGDLRGKRVLLTGASGCLGRAMGAALSRVGARLFLLDLNAEALAATAAQLGAEYMVCDVTDPSSVRRSHAAAVQKMGGIDGAILNAGVSGQFAPFGKMEQTALDQVMAVNVNGVFNGLNDLMPRMRAAGQGAIVIVASSGGMRGAAGMAPYVASKHAVLGLMKCAALEGARDGVRVTALSPGPIESEMMTGIDTARGGGDPSGPRSAVKTAIPAGRYARPEEVATMATFLLSDDAGYCNGAVYPVDGGLFA